MIDEKLLNEDLPESAIKVNQLTSAQFVRAVVTFTLIALLCFMLALEREIPAILPPLLTLVLGTYFDVPNPPTE